MSETYTRIDSNSGTWEGQSCLISCSNFISDISVNVNNGIALIIIDHLLENGAALRIVCRIQAKPLDVCRLSLFQQ
jgi:hypothetical protein